MTDAYSPKNYWTSLADGCGSMDASGFAPILHPLAPPWFNRLIDDLQFRAFQRALTLAAATPGSSLLDVGCGTGRWLRRGGDLGFLTFGVDATIGMLHIARSKGTKAPLATGLAQNLPFADAVFDCLSDITVVQHIPYELQSMAIKEMVRVLKPGGRMILMEVICRRVPQTDQDSHVFPRKSQDWIDSVENCGASLLGWFGQEFLLADRLFVRLIQTLYRRKGNLVGQVQSASYPAPSRKSSFAHRVYWQLRHITSPISVWVEPAVAAIFPDSLATHGVFIFQKKIEP